MRNHIAVLFLGLASVFSHAGDIETSSFTIDKIRTSSNTELVYIFPDGAVEVKNGTCSATNRYAIHKDSNLFEEMYSSALSAAMAGKNIKLWISTDANDCVGGYQRATLIEIDF